MEWTQELSVGVKEIDDQHKELISRVNAFFEAMKNDGKNSQVIEMLSFLESYVVTHFRDEEAIQVRYNYPNYITHRQIHNDFMKNVKALREQIENGFTVATASMVGMTLASWLVLHISKEDKAIGAHIRSLN